MPIYEYKCEKCEKIFELFQKVNDEPLKKCDCGGKTVRIFHPPGIVFKGSGFYTTDYKKSQKPVPTSQKEPKKTESNKSETKISESKKTEKKDSKSRN